MLSIGEASKRLGRTVQTLRLWHRTGKLVPEYVNEYGTRRYSETQINVLLGKMDNERISIGYCRVSSPKQKDDLQRQVEAVQLYLAAKGEPFEIITDIGSGINYGKPGLQRLITMINNRQVSKIAIMYKDRLLRFGYELIEYLAQSSGAMVEVIDNTPKTEQEELVEDLVQIITVFSCKLQGKRANKARKVVNQLVQDLQSKTETNGGTNSTDED